RKLRNRAVPLARRTRHDRDLRRQRIVADELEIRVATAEEARKLLLQPRIDAAEGVLEARARLAVDLAHRLFERFERGGQVGELPVEILLALRVLLQFVDRREIDLA